MRFLTKYLAAAAFMLASIASYGQTASISGYITDLESGETLIGAGVMSGRLGAASNSYGFYTLTLPKGRHSLNYSYIGYSGQTLEIDLQRDTLINVSLRPDNTLSAATVVASKDAGIKSTKMSAIELPMQIIKHTPVLFGEHDVLKTIQLMPGVQSGNEGLSGIYVRGGGPEENLLLLDGISLYSAEHLLGILSIFQPDAVKKVTLYKGSFPSRYGGRVSSIIDIRTNDGNMKEFKGSVGIGALTDKIHFEGPIIKDKLAYSISGRALHTFAYTPLIIKAVGTPANYYFYDLNAKLTWRISDKGRLFANFYNGRDIAYIKNSESYSKEQEAEGVKWETSSTSWNNFDLRWGNTLAGIRWNHIYNSKLFSNATFAYTRYKMRVTYDEGSRQTDYYPATKEKETSSNSYKIGYNSGIQDLTAKIDFDYTPSPAHLIKFGGEYVHHTFIPETLGGFVSEKSGGEHAVKTDSTFSSSANSVLRGHEMGIYAEDDINIRDRLYLNPGLRFTLFATSGRFYASFEPRMSLKYNFNSDWSAKAGYSRMAQYVHLLSPSAITLPTDLWVPITERIKPVVSDQVALGLYFTGIKGWEFSLEGYYKWMQNILEYSEGVGFSMNSGNWQNMVEMGEGRARGVELFIEKTLGNTTGWLGYTLAWSDRRFPDGSINNGKWFPYRYDRRHNISLVVNQSLGKGFTWSFTWTFASGNTMTLPERKTVVMHPDGELYMQNYISGRNNYRLPPSHRLNIGMSWERKRKKGSAVWELSVYNVYNRMNPNIVTVNGYTDDTGKTLQLEKTTLLPIIPSVGWTRNF